MRLHIRPLFNRLTITIIPTSGSINSPEDLNQYVLSSGDGFFYCGICNHQARKTDLKNHIESKHFPHMFSYQCPECSHVVGTKKALQRHKDRSHPKHWCQIVNNLTYLLKYILSWKLLFLFSHFKLGGWLFKKVLDISHYFAFWLKSWFRIHRKATRPWAVCTIKWRWVLLLWNL